MAQILHQQRLLLELLVMSGNIAVPATDNGTLLYATLEECKQAGWITKTPFGAGFDKAEITDAGRLMVKDRRTGEREGSAIDRRRARA